MTREELIKLAKAYSTRDRRIRSNPIGYFKPQWYQEDLWITLLKEIFVLGGNRTGKTTNGAAKIVKSALNNPFTSYWCNTWADMSIPVQQAAINSQLPPSRVAVGNYSEKNGYSKKIVILDNKSVIRFKTYEQGAASFQGTAKDGIWNDEEPPEDIYNECQARLIDRNGTMITTMTPLQGFTWVWNKKISVNDPNIAFWYWLTEYNEYIDQDAFRRVIAQFGEKEALARSKGMFVNMNEGRIYYAFDRDINVKELSVYPEFPLLLSFDFNVNPMTTSIAQIVPGKNNNEQDKVLNIIQAINTPDANTRKQCEILVSKLQSWNGEIIIYGDATNTRRTESANVNDTNWTIVKEYFPPSDKISYKVPEANPNIKERTGWVNSKIKNFGGQVGLYVNKDFAGPVIMDFEQVIWAKDGKTKDKSNTMLNHNSDNIDYIVAQEFPMRNIIPSQVVNSPKKIIKQSNKLFS